MNYKIPPQPIDDSDPTSVGWSDWYTKVRFAMNTSGLNFSDLTDVPANLVGFAGVSFVANQGVYATGPGTFAAYDLSTFFRSISDATDAEDLLTLIGATGTVSGTANQITATYDGDSDVTLSFPNSVIFPMDVTVTQDLNVNGDMAVANTLLVQEGGVFEAPAVGDTLSVDSIAGEYAIITQSDIVGTFAQWRLENTTAGAGFGAKLEIATTVGDPLIRFELVGLQDWSIGIDNSVSDTFVISRSATLGTNNVLSISTAGNWTIPAPDSGVTLTINQFAGSFGIFQSQSLIGTEALWQLSNTDNTSGTSHARILMAVGGGSAGDPKISFTVSGVRSYAIGIDNSDSDKFKISDTANLSGGSYFTIDPSGFVGVGTDNPLTTLHVRTTGTKLWLQDASAGASAISQTMAGLYITAGDMNTTSKYTPALMFGSTDSNFTTTNPKFGAIIVGEATQTYSADTTGGMAMVFFTQTNSPGTGGNLVERMRIEPTGTVVINDSDSGATLNVGGSNGAAAITTNSASAGGVILWRLENSDNTNAASHARFDVHVGGTSAGDPYIWYHNQSASWSVGMDNSVSDAYVIANGSGLATNPRVSIATAGNVTINAPDSGNALTVNAVNGSFGIIQSQAISGEVCGWVLENTSNTASSGSQLRITVGGTSAGDSWITLSITSSTQWALGLDNSDSDAFVLSNNTTLGTNNRLRVTTGGAVSFPSISTTASAANAFLDSGASNNLLRSTSSMRYKQDVRTLTDAKAKVIHTLRPVVYKSKAEADNPDVDWYGFIAEEVYEQEPRLIHYDEHGKPDGVQYDRLTVLLVHEVKKLRQELDELKRKQ